MRRGRPFAMISKGQCKQLQVNSSSYTVPPLPSQVTLAVAILVDRENYPLQEHVTIKLFSLP